MNTRAKMLQKLIDEKFNGSQIDFCRRSGKKEAQVTQWLNGHRNMKDTTAREIEKTIGLEHLYFEDISKIIGSNKIDLERNPEYPTIKKVKLKVSAGITGFTIDSYEPDTSPQAFREDWFIKNGFKPEKLLALTVSGESMEPTLYDGDTVVINTADTALKDGEVFVFNLDGEVVIKRAVKDSGQWWLDSDNKNNTRFTRKACPDGICIPIGRVVQKQSMRI